MESLIFGLILILLGLGLVVLNEQAAKIQKSVNDRLGMGGPSLKFYRIILYITGSILAIFGSLIMLGFFTLSGGVGT